MAHVFAAMDDGPRANAALTPEQRGSFENLILLCSTCHTMVDKAEEDFPDQLIVTWKRDHAARLTQVFGATHYNTRAEVRARVEPMLDENRAIFDELNPDLEYRENPEAEEAITWQQRVRERIIPNNRRILALLDVNRHLATSKERQTIERFRQHVHDLEAHHLTDTLEGQQRRFPAELTDVMKGE